MRQGSMRGKHAATVRRARGSRWSARVALMLAIVVGVTPLTDAIPSSASEDQVPPVVTDVTVPDASDDEATDQPVDVAGTGGQEQLETPGATIEEETQTDEQFSDEIVDEPQDALAENGHVMTDEVAPEIGLYAMPTGRNYLTWDVRDAAGNPVGGATVQVQGPR